MTSRVAITDGSIEMPRFSISDMGKAQKQQIAQLKRQSTIVINPLDTFDYSELKISEKLKFLLYHYSDVIILIAIIAIITILIINHYDKDDLNDIILNNALIMLTVYYSAVIALKGYNLSMKVHTAADVETVRRRDENARLNNGSTLLQ